MSPAVPVGSLGRPVNNIVDVDVLLTAVMFPALTILLLLKLRLSPDVISSIWLLVELIINGNLSVIRYLYKFPLILNLAFSV